MAHKHIIPDRTRQGMMLYDAIPTMPEPRLRPLLQRFSDLLVQHRAFTGVFAHL